jgi:hypothetical protein
MLKCPLMGHVKKINHQKRINKQGGIAVMLKIGICLDVYRGSPF